MSVCITNFRPQTINPWHRETVTTWYVFLKKIGIHMRTDSKTHKCQHIIDLLYRENHIPCAGYEHKEEKLNPTLVNTPDTTEDGPED